MTKTVLLVFFFTAIPVLKVGLVLMYSGDTSRTRRLGKGLTASALGCFVWLAFVSPG